jgi:Leucine rich repeat/Leucine Rich repeat
LLQPPAVGDNAAMEAEPPKADPPKRKRRWFQFSLRSLMIFTAIVAVGCGWIGRRMEQKRKEREAVEAIVRLKGEVFYDYQRETVEDVQPSGPAWLRKLLGENFFSEVDAVLLYDSDVTDAGLANLEGLSELQTLVLTGTKVTDVGLSNLRGLAHLQNLTLSGDTITDAGLVNLSQLPRLQELDLARTNITDAALKHLSGLKQLRTLNLRGTKVTDAGLKHLKGLSQLKQLALTAAKVFSNAGVEELQDALPNCEVTLGLSVWWITRPARAATAQRATSK